MILQHNFDIKGLLFFQEMFSTEYFEYLRPFEFTCRHCVVKNVLKIFISTNTGFERFNTRKIQNKAGFDL